MTQDEIIEMAKQAGYKHPDAVGQCEDFAYFNIEAFAKLIAAKERKACIHACKEIYSAWVCESDDDVDYPNPNDCIRAIRARGEA